MDHRNTDTGTRVELHCHTKLGSIGAVNSAAEIIKAAIEEDMSAVAITDVGVCLCFSGGSGGLQIAVERNSQGVPGKWNRSGR